jgi:hypothetical protein
MPFEMIAFFRLALICQNRAGRLLAVLVPNRRARDSKKPGAAELPLGYSDLGHVSRPNTGDWLRVQQLAAAVRWHPRRVPSDCRSSAGLGGPRSRPAHALVQVTSLCRLRSLRFFRLASFRQNRAGGHLSNEAPWLGPFAILDLLPWLPSGNRQQDARTAPAYIVTAATAHE